MEERNVFKFDFVDYRTYLNPTQDYIVQMATFFSRKYNIAYQEAEELIKEKIKEKGPNNPNVIFKDKNPYGDMEISKTKLFNYLEKVKKEKRIIAPSFTVYQHPDEEKSVHSDLLFENVRLRNIDKKKAHYFKMKEDHDNESFYNTNQKTRKIENNGLSGSYASTSTILYNPSSHFTLTSITRCVSGVGNALSEMLVAGNRYFRDTMSVVNYIVSSTSTENYELIKQVVDKYNIVVPSFEEIFSYLKQSWIYYWKNRQQENYILHLLSTLDKYSLACVLYINDLWALKTYNEEFVRTLVTRLAFKQNYKVEKPLEALDDTIEGVNTLVHHIFANELRGREVKYKDMIENSDLLVYDLAATADNIRKTLVEYSDLIHAFFVTDIMPPNVAYIKDMYRKVIVLSDTDSTCCSYDKWVEWYFGEMKVDAESLGVSATIMTMTTQLMDHVLRMLAKNINTGRMGEKDNYLQMKNEYCWPVFVVANVTKHYFASTMIQEGNVYRKNKLEKKGVHYISSTVGGDVVKEAERLMWLILNSAERGEKISIKQLCTEVANLERKILEDYGKGLCYMFKKDSIKPAKSYKQSEEESKYVNHTLWCEVFGEQYGYPGEPPYAIYTIPLKVSGPNDWVELINHIRSKNPVLAENLVKAVNKYKKDKCLKTLRIPKLIADGQGIPGEFREFVNIRQTIEQSLISLYYVLETVGYFKKPGYLLMDLNF